VRQRRTVGREVVEGSDELQRLDRLAGRVDERADPLAPSDEAAGEKGVERVADGDPADPVGLAQPLLGGERRAGGELVGADSGAKVLLELIVEGHGGAGLELHCRKDTVVMTTCQQVECG
jgi:hypothetical protein